MQYTTDKGIDVVINKAPFGVIGQLKGAIAQGLLDNKINLNEDIDSSAIMAKIILIVESSPAIQKALFACLGRCLYGSKKITMETFEDEDAQAEYYTIIAHCLEENLSVFMRGALSKS
jgi:hypothetical protein